MRTRFWMEAALAGLSCVLMILAFAWPEWIELLFGVDPDGGSGELEWAIAGVLLVATAAFSALARRDWRAVYQS